MPMKQLLPNFSFRVGIALFRSRRRAIYGFGGPAFAAAVFFLTAALHARACPMALPTIPVTAKGVHLVAEVAAVPEARSCGLSHRSELPQNHGMLFVFQNTKQVSFWMKDTHIPLSIAFIDDHGQIVDIQKMDPIPSTQTYNSPLPVRYALEVNQGWFEKNGIGLGDRVEFDLPVTLNIR
jgi:uncharacterized membrane protein (UPF0127 family)